MRQRCLALPCLPVLGLIGCSSDQVELRIHVKNLTSDIVALQVSATLGATQAQKDAEFTQRLDELSIKLTKSELGQEQLRVDLFGIDASRCKHYSAVYKAQVSADFPNAEFDLSLAPMVRPELILVPKTQEPFTMGSASTESTQSDEQQHQVTLTTDFAMAETEVTQLQYQNLMETNPSQFKGCELPVERVGWLDAVRYCNALSIKEGLEPCYQIPASGTLVTWVGSCVGYRLPTEAEWEYAARAPTNVKWAGSDSIDNVAWYNSNSGSTTHIAKTKNANARGLYDLTGNVYEWVWDGYKPDYQTLPSENPISPPNGSTRMYKGGSWDHSSAEARVAFRQYVGLDNPALPFNYLGFRIVRSYP